MVPLFREPGLNVEERHAVLVRLGRNRCFGPDGFLQASIGTFFFVQAVFFGFELLPNKYEET